jgi:hypothetical protein
VIAGGANISANKPGFKPMKRGFHMKKFTFVLACLLSSEARAHSWYEPRCCSDRDCFPTTEVLETPFGTFYQNRPVEPRVIRRGMDDSYHVCVRGGQILCVYTPLRSF